MKKKLWRIMLFVGLICFFCMSFASAEKTVLRVGYVDTPGYLTRDMDGHYHGYAYEYMESLARYGGWSMEYIAGSRTDCEARLVSGAIDVLPGILPNSQNTARFDFSQEFFCPVDLFLNLRGGRPAQASDRIYRIGYCLDDYEAIWPSLQRVAQKEKLQYVGVPYEDSRAAIRAYLQRDLDGIVLASLYERNLSIPMELLVRKRSYIAVRKGNRELLTSLDEAARSLFLVAPGLRTQLYSEHFANRLPLLLTSEEKAYLKKRKKLVFLATPGQKPFSYFENGMYKGVLEEIVGHIAADLGVDCQVVQLGSYSEILQAMQTGQYDAILDFFHDYNWAREQGVDLSFPYMQLNYVAVMRRSGQLSASPRIACLRNHFYTQEFVETRYDSNQLVYYDTPQECLEAVSNGTADMTFVNSITAQQDIWSGNFYDLMVSGTVAFSHMLSLGVNQEADEILLRILNKELQHLDPSMVQNFTNKAALNMKRESSLTSLIYQYPLYFVLGLLSLALLMLGSFGYILHLRHRHIGYISRLAYTDADTGLPNMRAFLKDAGRRLTGLENELKTGRLFVMIIGVKRFDLLKDLYGQAMLLEYLCRTLAGCRREHLWILDMAVLSGTGRVACFCCLPEGEDVVRLVPECVPEHGVLQAGNLEVHMELQVGVCSLSVDSSHRLQDAVDAAELAYHDLWGSRARIRFFNKALRQEQKLQKKIEDQMNMALEKKEFHVWYQPKYNLKTHEIIGAEALVRWYSATLGKLMPGQFIPLFEKNGFIISLDYYMLDQVCSVQHARVLAGEPLFPVSVNQSGLHMNEEGYLEKIRRIVEYYALPPKLVELDITETAFVDLSNENQRRKIAHIIYTLQEMGFLISMDDFGSGYSSLAMLQRLPMDVMKIDRSLLVTAGDSERAQCILENVIRMGNSLHMQVICEGIETEAQEQQLLAHGCLYGQGFRFAPPMEEQAFIDLLEQKRKLSGA